MLGLSCGLVRLAVGPPATVVVAVVGIGVSCGVVVVARLPGDGGAMLGVARVALNWLSAIPHIVDLLSLE